MSPSSSAAGSLGVLPDNGVATLKASAPSIVSPASGQLSSGSVQIVATNSAGLFVSIPLSLEFEVWEDTATPRLVASQILPQSGGTTTSYNVPGVLGGANHALRVRARYGDLLGPWSAVVTVSPPPFLGNDDIDANSVIYLHRNIADWEQISVMDGAAISITPSQICFPHSGAGSMPRSIFIDLEIEGNVWVFAPINGQWYGATWDWLRVGQVCKGENLETLGVDQIRIPPMDHNWRAPFGSPICFAVSSRARDDVEGGRARTNIACTTVPY